MVTPETVRPACVSCGRRASSRLVAVEHRRGGRRTHISLCAECRLRETAIWRLWWRQVNVAEVEL